MKKILKNFLLAILVFFIIASIFAFYKTPLTKTEEISLTQLSQNINDSKVKQITISGNDLKIKLNDDKDLVAKKEAETSLTNTLKNYGVKTEHLDKVNITVTEDTGFTYWMANILPFVLPFLLVGVFIWFMARGLQKSNSKAMMFGESRAKKYEPEKGKKKITFKDVAGAKEAKEELWEVVEFLKSPKKFSELGAEIPKGVLLIGPPGTGKTLLAKAVANEANVPFYSISGSEFVEMFVGVGASRVRDLFDKAKKTAPCLIFIDEIDAVGRHRGAGLGGSHDEREQTLNQILSEMDGFVPNSGIVVIAATNRPDVLDPALLRPGRFDRRVILDLPDMQSREAILKIHAKNKPLDKEVDIKVLAQRTPGFSGADLKNLMNEAAISAARENKKTVSMKHCVDSIEKVMLGPERKSFMLSKEEKKIAAYHEAGHALTSHLLPNADPVQKISIISRGQAAGYTLKLPEKEKHFHAKAEFLDDLAVLLGGYVAEKLTFGDVTTGATSDLRQVTAVARKLVTDYGMSDLGPMTFGQKEELVFLGKEIGEQRDYSEAVAAEIDKAVRGFVESGYKKSQETIENNKAKLEKIANALIDHEVIEKEEFNKLMSDENKNDVAK
ncbi:MAG: ATP-dependent zinc metalloprotease FtsH [Patescibacteria group bacterium]|nr:ATP-dependent zinc metalloprotease FtsH [Patescibacteria group bacterium]